MGLTTSCEAIERQANPAENEPDPKEVHVGRAFPKGDVSDDASDSPEASASTKRTLEESEPRKKKSKQDLKEVSGRTGASTPARPPASNKPPAKKSTPKPASSSKPRPALKKTPSKTPAKASVKTPSSNPNRDAKQTAGAAEEPQNVARPSPMNAHKTKILIGKQALSVIKEGTRIYIKSGEGNGGDTWWDSGVIRKVHERGRRFEVNWEGINNRGEEVDAGGEKRIDLPVTYSLGGAAAAVIGDFPTGTQAAARARKGVLAEARIGSWCIQYPQEPWGMLDPFGEDAT